MALLRIASQEAGRLTDVQLIHKLNDAIAARERQAADQYASRAGRLLRRLPASAPWLAVLVAAAVQMRDAVKGGWLAVRLAPAERLAEWASASDARLRSVDADLRIIALIAEVERRVDRTGAAGMRVPAQLRRG